jgi:hypothetical protein
MRLELGAGYRPTPGYTHQDARPGDDIEIIGDAAHITEHPHIGKEACEIIRATHLLEHFSFRETHNVLHEWHTALKPGGTIYIEVPHFGWQTRAHANGQISDEEAVTFVFGEQDYEGNFHFAAFTENLLRQKLSQAGFQDIHIQDIGQVLIATGVKGDSDDRPEMSTV